MTNITYDPEVDAVCISVAKGKVEGTEEAGPFIYDMDSEGRMLGIEILTATKTLAPGDWQNARLPGKARFNAAEHVVRMSAATCGNGRPAYRGHPNSGAKPDHD